jgi:hypothetical protein
MTESCQFCCEDVKQSSSQFWHALYKPYHDDLKARSEMNACERVFLFSQIDLSWIFDNRVDEMFGTFGLVVYPDNPPDFKTKCRYPVLLGKTPKFYQLGPKITTSATST